MFPLGMASTVWIAIWVPLPGPDPAEIDEIVGLLLAVAKVEQVEIVRDHDVVPHVVGHRVDAIEAVIGVQQSVALERLVFGEMAAAVADAGLDRD
jgi:hypothetical protein